LSREIGHALSSLDFLIARLNRHSSGRQPTIAGNCGEFLQLFVCPDR
jgi:hypothetical protein